ncbi:hypothetical protein FRC09_013988 [Ceratobasidium sp. 395]|nr:hypothetical protein FRC09_013988 [Ceratobasidium sp. 395]
MPAHRRQRPNQRKSTIRSPAKSKEASSGDIPFSAADWPMTPTTPPVDLGTPAGSNTPTKPTTSEQFYSATSSPTGNATVAQASALSQNEAPADVDMSQYEPAPESTCSKEGGEPQKDPMNSPDNPFVKQSPAPKNKLPKSETLHEAIERTYLEVAALMARRDSFCWLTAPRGKSGVPFIDRALNDLRVSRHVLWLGDSHTILRDCEWVSGDRPLSATLQWKSDTSNKLAQGGGDAMVGFVGVVSSDRLSMSPDAGWQTEWGEEKLHKVKRSFRVVDASRSFNIQPAWFLSQMEGAARIVDKACKSAKKNEYDITHCFVHEIDGYLRTRTPLFMPIQTVEYGDEDDDADADADNEASSSEEREYSIAVPEK